RVRLFISGTLARSMTRRFTENSAVITMMPDSTRLIWKRVCNTPVTVPATMPLAKAAPVASSGCTPATSRTATTAAPSVMEPSAVMSGNENSRKLMKAPKASRDRIRPMVSAPSNRSMRSIPDSRGGRQQRAGPEGAAHEFALACSQQRALVMQQVQQPGYGIVAEQRRDGLAQVQRALAQRPEREG